MEGHLILDGPTGTELIARGFKAHPELWTARASLDAPELLSAIHADYLAAGANILTANTFRTTAYAAAKAGLSEAEARKMMHSSVALATEAIEAFGGDGPHFVAGSLAPLEDCYQPRLAPPLAVMEREHLRNAEQLLEAGCDIILAETMGTAREATVAVRAARKAGADSVAVSFITDPTGTRLLGGDPLAATALECVRSGAETIMVNCVHPDVVEKALPLLRDLLGVGAVIGAYANAARMELGLFGEVTWQEDTRPEAARAAEYATRAADWKRRFGARVIGSCCGTSVAYIARLSAALASG